MQDACENYIMVDLTHAIPDLENLFLVLDNLRVGIIAHTPKRINYYF